MLLCGSFQNQVISLINILRFDEKRLSVIQGPPLENSAKLNTDTGLDCEPESEELLQVTSSKGEDASEDGLNLEDVRMEENWDVKASSSASRRKDWRRVRKSYIRSKQYIFVAATLPVSGKKTAGGILKRMFPEASWISGNYLHCYNPRCEGFDLFLINFFSYFLSFFPFQYLHCLVISNMRRTNMS